MEIFLWSPSGEILLGSLTSRYRVLLCYVLDTPQSSFPTMFMSDMQYAHSLLAKFVLPTVLVCNKTDIPFSTDWIESEVQVDDGVHRTSNLMGYMSVVLEKFRDRLEVFPVRC
jgi:GPN-loop GTPase